jgi:hypothetical protein
MCTKRLKKEQALPLQTPFLHMTCSSHHFCLLDDSSSLDSIYSYLLKSIHICYLVIYYLFLAINLGGIRPGMVVHISNPSQLGSGNRRIAGLDKNV